MLNKRDPKKRVLNKPAEKSKKRAKQKDEHSQSSLLDSQCSITSLSSLLFESQNAASQTVVFPVIDNFMFVTELSELQQATKTLRIQRLCVVSTSVVCMRVFVQKKILRQFLRVLHTSEVQSSSMSFLRSSVTKSSVLVMDTPSGTGGLWGGRWSAVAPLQLNRKHHHFHLQRSRALSTRP